MKIDISELEKGRYIKFDITNHNHEYYGPMRIVSVKVITEKFCTRLIDWGGYHPSVARKDYIDRQTVILKMRNEQGKLVTRRFWLDDLTNPNWTFPDIVFLSSTDLQSAHEEVEKMVAREILDSRVSELRQFVLDAYPDLFKYINIIGNEKEVRIKELMGELVKLL